jgi:hypothetical protein
VSGLEVADSTPLLATKPIEMAVGLGSSTHEIKRGQISELASFENGLRLGAVRMRR